LMEELKLRDDLVEMQQGNVGLGLEVYEKPFYDRLKTVLPADVSQEALAVLARNVVNKLNVLAVIDWSAREDVKREMRRQVKGILRKNGIPANELDATTIALVKLAERWITL